MHRPPSYTDVRQPQYGVDALRKLFDEMSRTYGVVNFISSFGFCRRWRRQCIDRIDLRPGDVVVDLMSGMGEVSHFVAPRIGPDGRVIAIDFSEKMCLEARRRTTELNCSIEILSVDALDSGLKEACADAVSCAFGLKTLAPDALPRLALEVHRILRPGGRFTFLEISTPPPGWLRRPFMFYLGRVVPWIGRLLLGNPDNYRMLGIYTRAFGDCREAADCFRTVGLEVIPHRFFFGCATGFSGRKPS